MSMFFEAAPSKLSKRLREAFHRKSGETWELVQIEGGIIKKSKKSQVSVGKCSKIMNHFHLMRTQKHNILSIVISTLDQFPSFPAFSIGNLP